MTKISFKFVASVMAIVFTAIMIILCGLSIYKINILNDEIGYLNNRITRLDNNDGYIRWEIDELKEEIIRLLEEQGKNYYDVSHEITDINASANIAIVNVYFSLKESALSGDVEVSYGKDGQFTQLPATKLASGKYMATLQLQTDKDYEISYSVILSSVKTEKLLQINVLKELKERFYVSASFNSYNYGDWALSFYLMNRHDNNYNLKIVTATLEVFKDGILIKTINLKQLLTSDEYYETCENKKFEIEGLTDDVFSRSDITTKITIVDGFGIEYDVSK